MSLQDPFFEPPRGATAAAARVDVRGRPATRRELLIAAAVALLAALVFVGKAVAQDDWAYLEVARLIGEHGLAGAQEQTTLYQGRPISVAEGVLHGPVWTLLLRAAAALPGGLFPAHLCSMLCLALLAASACSLAARLGAPPVPTALALALSPGPLVLSGGLMTDLPALAFLCGSLALALRGLRTAELWALLLSGGFGVAAALTRFHALPAVLGLLLAAPLLLRGRGARAWIPLAVTLLGLSVYLGWTRFALGELDLVRGLRALAVSERDHGPRTQQALLATVCGLGGLGLGWWLGALTAPTAARRAALSDPTRALLLLIAAVLGVWLGLEGRGGGTGGGHALSWLFQWLCFVLGSMALVLALVPLLDLLRIRSVGVRGWLAQRGPEAWLACWLLGSALIAWRGVPFGAARYALPCLPPLFLLAGIFAARHLPARVPRAALVASALLGLACAQADWRATDVYRSFARDVAARRAPGGPWEQGELWIHGELGFRWYLEREAGGRVLASDSNAPRAGDRVLRSATCTDAVDDGSRGNYLLHQALSRRLLNEDVERYQDRWPVRVHNHFAGAGFYGAAAGYLPFAFGTARHDELQTWIVKGENWFFEHMREALIDTGVVLEHADGRRTTGSLEVRRARISPEDDNLQSLVYLLPGRATWRIELPEGAVLRARVGELERNWLSRGDPLVPGPGSLVRVRIDGQVVWELELDTRRRDEDRGWKALELDLAPWGGRSVSLTIEADARRPPPDGLDPAYERFIYVAVAEPEVVQP